MKILALEREVVGLSESEYQPYLRAEALRAWELHQAGVIRDLYFRADAPSAVLVLECRDIDEATSALGTLPLVEQGLIQFDLVPLRPYPGFERLFRPDDAGDVSAQPEPARSAEHRG
jgi:hypothetical protein